MTAFVDEAGDIAVIGAEILAPFGKTVGFVKNPRADFALRQHFAHAAVAQLLRGNEQDADVAEADTVEGLKRLVS